jgi:hypothetical protein
VLAKRFPGAPLAAVGYSLGANVLLKYLGERGEASRLRAAAAISIPFDLGAGADKLQSTLAGRIYTGYYFMRHTNMLYWASTAHVGAYGYDSHYCNIDGWFGYGNGVEVRTRCFTSAGVPVDAPYVESYGTRQFRLPC